MHAAVSAAAPCPSGVRPDRSFGIVSSFPPTSCGIATFSAALAAGMIIEGASVQVVRPGPLSDLDDVLVTGSLTGSGFGDAIEALRGDDVVVIQHEYGLYGGPDGASILDVVAALDGPIVVVAHTVLSEPTANQRDVLERLCAAADAVVVMTATARRRLITGFHVDPTIVVVIPHGATIPSRRTSDQLAPGRPPRLLTWGLLGPGKGIEWAIDALSELGDVLPRPEYVIAGATHPKVRERDGESYREMLVARAAASSASIPVIFDDRYRDLGSLTELIESADLVVLPYDSRDQVTSGVLVDAVAAGRPVVSTTFPHAVELLASGAGIVVPPRDPLALGRAIRSVLTDDRRAAAMAAEARRLAPRLAWPAVARRYVELGNGLLARREPVAP